MKQFGDLSAADFDAAPVWVACHVLDYDEPWHDDTDEETFRPWDRALPVDPGSGFTFLVSAEFELAASTSPLKGFVTPQPDGLPDFGSMQPHLFLPSGRVGAFWLGMFGEPDVGFCRSLLALGEPVFPIRFSPLPGLSLGLAAGALDGFYRWSETGAVLVRPSS